MVWMHVQVALLIGLLLAATASVVQAEAGAADPTPNACDTTDGFVRVPTGTKSATGFLFTPTAHGTYLYEIPLLYPGGTFTLTRSGSSSVTVLGNMFPDFDLLVDVGGGNSQKHTATGDDGGRIHSSAVALYVYMPHGPDPILIDDGRADGAAFTFTQCQA